MSESIFCVIECGTGICVSMWRFNLFYRKFCVYEIVDWLTSVSFDCGIGVISTTFMIHCLLAAHIRIK